MADDLYGEKSIPYFMSMEDSLDIDTFSDLEEAKRRLEKSWIYLKDIFYGKLI